MMAILSGELIAKLLYHWPHLLLVLRAQFYFKRIIFSRFLMHLNCSSLFNSVAISLFSLQFILCKYYISIDNNLAGSGISQVIPLNSVSITQEYTFSGLWIQLCSFLGVVHHIHRTSEHMERRIICWLVVPHLHWCLQTNRSWWRPIYHVTGNLNCFCLERLG